MSTSPSPGSPKLIELIRREIRDLGPIPFSRFMELALHHPEHGYYARGEQRLGPRGDYVTASDVGPPFGRCLARQLFEMDALLGRPDPFTLLDWGGGRGLLARDVLDSARALGDDFARRIRYVLVDRSPGMRRAAARRSEQVRVVAPEQVDASHVGCVVAVELFDALPVHRLRRAEAGLREVFVGLDREGGLVEREGTPVPEALALAERYGAAPGEGDEAEVCPAALAELDRLAGSIRSGFLLLVDYGYDASELYGPRHRRGTLLAYHRHRTNEDYLARVGEQDLTAHVNFTALEDHARARGLELLGRTSQDRFLIANGILSPFDEKDPERWRDPRRVQERLQVLQLIHPQGMGRAFQVLAIARSVWPRPLLTGLRDPFARH